MKTLTICGSMRFAEQMREIAYLLEVRDGYNVLQCVYGGETGPDTSERERLAAAHYRKIELSDGIYVVNIGGYIGDSVRREIEYARHLGKDVLYHEK